MPPLDFGGDAVLAPVDVEALAEGLCLAAQRAPAGAGDLFCGRVAPEALGSHRLGPALRPLAGCTERDRVR